MTEDGKQRDEPAARLAEATQRRLEQIGGDLRLGFQRLDQCGRIWIARPNLAQREADQHGAGCRPPDQALHERIRQDVPGHLPDERVCLAVGQAAQVKYLEPVERQLFPANHKEPRPWGSRQVLDHRRRLRLRAEQVRVVQEDQRTRPAKRGRDQMQLLVSWQRVLGLAQV